MKIEELTLSTAYGECKLTCYEYTESPEMPTDSRPAMLVLPGGGYAGCSDREAEPIALAYFGRGYNAYVLRYTCAPARYPTQLVQAAAAMDTVRKRANGCKTDKNRVFVVGFSAGGHLCGSLANCPRDFAPVKQYDFAPNGVVLAYPVIGGTPTHGGSFDNLLGGKPHGETEWLNLHTSVKADNPPAFIWTTADDNAVPAINSLRYAEAYAEKGLRYELHVYPHGPHGLALANEITYSQNPALVNEEVARWVVLSDKFLRSL